MESAARSGFESWVRVHVARIGIAPCPSPGTSFSELILWTQITEVMSASACCIDLCTQGEGRRLRGCIIPQCFAFCGIPGSTAFYPGSGGGAALETPVCPERDAQQKPISGAGCLSAVSSSPTGFCEHRSGPRRGGTVGHPFFWLLYLLAKKKSDSPRRAKPVISGQRRTAMGHKQIRCLFLVPRSAWERDTFSNLPSVWLSRVGNQVSKYALKPGVCETLLLSPRG